MAAALAPAAGPEERPFPEPVRLRLRRAVLALDYAGCARLLTRLLEELGYEDVRPAGRTNLKGYNRPGGGGWDLAATLNAGVGSRRMVVRLKHSPREHSGADPRPVHQRCVDELRGACLRAGASEGLLVATGEFSLTARRLAALETRTKGGAVAPVRLVDGEELVELLLARRVGVREVFVFPGKRRLEVDEGLFRDLRGKTPAGHPAAPRRASERTKVVPRASRWRVTVQLVSPNADTPGRTGRGGYERGGYEPGGR